ncbi:MarR family transcriptional regulator [Luteimicrobium album]|uniref:MarR family transcriptional regulator n=1 Tax=Luteimicrobium album TaxID=1054550 RepID=A0ABQ6I349_9MICO|nr:MarR family transcriptional regulator [Luteimicrobium album]GMA24935.1 MarR family transcriptional regulator [Luteimicrobium album]
MREARVQLSALNHRIGSGVDVRDTDFDCLDLVSVYGPISPGALARLAGVRPATMTGILDRLERGGWIVRDRDAIDRRAVVLRVLPDRNAEVLDLYAGMNARLDQICADYDDAQLELIAGFLQRVQRAAADSAEELGGGRRGAS